MGRRKSANSPFNTLRCTPKFTTAFRIDDKNVVPFNDKDEGFYVRASKGDLPAVTFIDPNFRDIPPIHLADDDLPPADVN